MNKNSIVAVVILVFAIIVPATSMADTIRTKDGITCTNLTDRSPLRIETYANTALGNGDSRSVYAYRDYRTNKNDYKVGVKLNYYFGAPKPLECSRLYELELRSKEARLEELEAKIDLLRAGSNITWNKDSSSTTK